MSVKISGEKYAMMYGPTTGDKVRLADTDLIIEVEKDYTTYGDEIKFGGGKTIRDGMGQSVKTTSADGDLDLVITNALIVDSTGIIKADIFSIRFIVSIIHFIQPCPVNSTQAHRTRFAGSIYFITAKVKGSEFGSCCTDSTNFCMRSRIAGCRYTIDTGSDNFTFFCCYDGTERTSSVSNILFGKLNSFPHKFFFSHHTRYTIFS